MRLRRKLACISLTGAMVLTLSAGGCPGETSEEILYCFVLNAMTGGESNFEPCEYDYEIPDEDRALAAYEDDLRAYQALAAFGSATGPGMPTPAQFMASRYPDWPARAASLRASLSVPVSAPSSPDDHEDSDQ